MESREPVVAEQQEEGDQDQEELAARGHTQAARPQLHGVEQRKAEEQAAGDAARILPERLIERPLP